MPLGVLAGAIGSPVPGFVASASTYALGSLAPTSGLSSLGVLQSVSTALSDFQIQIIQLSHALSQKKDIDKVLSYLYIIRDDYLNNIVNTDYFNKYPTPSYAILS
jgi:hypothetical protein